MSNLRARQKAMARQAIVEACAELVNSTRHLDFSMQEVAKAAGVSLRTIYNHFDTREDLLDAVVLAWNDAMAELGMFHSRDLTSWDQIEEAIRINVPLFGQLSGLSEAFAQMSPGEAMHDPDRAQRTARIAETAATGMPDVPEEVALQIGLFIRHLISSRSWFWLTREYGLSTETVVELDVWAFRTLTEAARRGDLPAKPLPEPRTSEDDDEHLAS